VRSLLGCVVHGQAAFVDCNPNARQSAVCWFVGKLTSKDNQPKDTK
jgi:hypothetical protein